ERLGGEAVTVPGRNAAEEIVAYAGANNFTHIVVRRPPTAWWWIPLRASVAQELIRRAGDISVHVIAGSEGEPIPPKTVATEPRGEALDAKPYGYATVVVALALGIGVLLHHVLNTQSVALVFLTAVLVSAVAWGLAPSLLACFLSVLAFNFFFL